MYSFIADSLDCTYCACHCQFSIKEETVGDTPSGDSVTLCLSSLRAFTRK